MKQPGRIHLIRPPFRLAVLLIGTLFVSFQGWQRFVLSLSNWALYEAIGVNPGVWYLTLNGLLTGSIYLFTAILILLPGAKFRRLTSICLLLGLTIYWFDRIFAAISPESRISLPFSLVSSVILTIIALGILYWDTIIKHLTRQEK